MSETFENPLMNNDYQEPSFTKKFGLFLFEAGKIIVLAGITIVLIRFFLFKPFYVKGQSMEPNFYEKDYLIIDEITYRFRAPERGEVVVFRSPVADDFYLKRVLGLPGERIKIDSGKVIIYNDTNPQGVLVEELYLEEETPGSITVTLEDDQYFVIGDNRDASFDSRRFGPIAEEDIVGRVWFRGWPFSRISSFGLPEYNL